MSPFIDVCRFRPITFCVSPFTRTIVYIYLINSLYEPYMNEPYCWTSCHTCRFVLSPVRSTQSESTQLNQATFSRGPVSTSPSTEIVSKVYYLLLFILLYVATMLQEKVSPTVGSSIEQWRITYISPWASIPGEGRGSGPPRNLE